MKSIITSLIFFISASSLASEPPKMPTDILNMSFGGGDGLSVEQAITFLNDPKHQDIVMLERMYIRSVYPDHKKSKQAMVRADGIAYDKITIKNQSGKETNLYFDIGTWVKLE